MLRAPSSHGKSVLLGIHAALEGASKCAPRCTRFAGSLPPKSAFTREPSPCRPARHPSATSSTRIVSLGGGATTEKLYVLNSSAGAARDQSRAGSMSRVAPRTCTRPLWIRTARGGGSCLKVPQRRVSVSSVLCVRLRDESKESTRVDARPRDTAAMEQWDPRRQVGRFTDHMAALLLS